MFMPINTRIILFFESLHIEKKDFADKIGIAPTSLQNILSKTSTPNSKILYKFLQSYPNVSAEWLLRGIEPMLLNLVVNENTTIVSEPQTEYKRSEKEELSNLKIDIIESERQLYERIIKSKDETIEILKMQIDNLKK